MDVNAEEYSLLTELANSFAYPTFDSQKHITVKMLAEKLDTTIKTARNYLEKEIKNGTLEKEWIRLDNGYMAWGYYKDLMNYSINSSSSHFGNSLYYGAFRIYVILLY